MRIVVEVRECVLCKQPTVYWGGQFRHLALVCEEKTGGIDG